MNKTIKINNWNGLPDNFTGIAEHLDGTKEWFKEGKRHRIDGPAVENVDGTKYWWIESCGYSPAWLRFLIQTSVYLGKEKGNHNLDWLRFLTEQGIKEFPVIPGMEQDNGFIPLFNKVFGATSK